MIEASGQLAVMFMAMGITLALLFTVGVWQAYRRTGASEGEARRALVFAALGSMAWLVATYALARAGRLTFDSIPPTMLIMMVLTIILMIRIARTGVGQRLSKGIPLWVLIAVQGFRLPLELMMHTAYEEGVMPVEMSYSGRNFDIITGITALIVAALIASGRAGPTLARVWNWLGVGLLLNVVVIAILSAPLPFRVFMDEPSNIWVTQAPFVWLPTVMVAFAMLGHLVIFRHLRMVSSQQTPPAFVIPHQA